MKVWLIIVMDDDGLSDITIYKTKKDAISYMKDMLRERGVYGSNLQEAIDTAEMDKWVAGDGSLWLIKPNRVYM